MKAPKLCLIMLVTMLSHSAVATAGRRSAAYDIKITDATVTTNDSAYALIIRSDTTGDDNVESLVIHDSLEFALRYLHKSASFELQLVNRSDGQVLLIWDSTVATDTEGRKLQVIPFDRGVEISTDFKFPAKKVGAGKKFKSSIMTLERGADGSIRLTSVLVEDDDYYPGDQFLRVLQELKSRNFTIQPVIQRGAQLFKYRFTYLIADARVQ